MHPAAALGNLGPQKHDDGGGGVSAVGGDGVERGISGNSAKGTNGCASPSTRIQGNAQSITDEEFISASSDHADNLEIRAESEIKQFAARGPGGKPAVGKTQISHQEEKLQPIQGQTPQLTQGHWQTSQPPHGQIPQSSQGQKSLPPHGQTHQSTQEQTPQPPQGQTSQPAREQTSQSPEQQTPQTTGGQEPPVKGKKKRRPPATTATSATTAG